MAGERKVIAYRGRVPRRTATSRGSRIAAAPLPPRWQIVLSLVVLAVAGVLLFARLGHRPLWDDEAGTALIGQGVWQTGDTSVVIGHNVMGYRDGAELVGLKARYLPPLQQYLAAPFVGHWPGSALAARMPFALLGFATVALILWWLWRDRAGRTLWLLTVIALIGNASFWLYCRQARYYSLIIFLSVAIVYLYLHFDNRWWVALLIGLTSAALIASSYLAYAALYGAIGVDWLIWGRRRIRPGLAGWLFIFAPQVILGGPIVWIWWPIGKGLHYPDESSGIYNRWMIFWSFWEELNNCEFGVLLLVLIAPLLWFWRREQWMLRGPMAVLIFVLVTTLASPQKLWMLTGGHWEVLNPHVDVRYLCPLIPLLIALGAGVVATLIPPWRWRLAIPLGGIVFFTNVLQGGMGQFIGPQVWPLHSTLYAYCQELLHPGPDPYSAAIDWLKAHVQPNQGVMVMPEFMRYPLMYHVPEALYVWQFDPGKRAEYPTLPAEDFQYNGTPKYVIVFGRGAPPVRSMELPNYRTYELTQVIDVYAKDLYRPELFNHAFAPVTDFDPRVMGIRVYELR